MEYFQRRTESSWAETLSIAIIQRLHSVRNHFGTNAFQREILCIGSLNVSLRVSFEELALTRPQTLGQIFLSGQKKNWLYLLCVRYPVLHHSKSTQESAEDELKQDILWVFLKAPQSPGVETSAPSGSLFRPGVPFRLVKRSRKKQAIFPQHVAKSG